MPEKNDSLVTPEWPAVMHLSFVISSADWRMATVAFCRTTKRSLIDTNTAGRCCCCCCNGCGADGVCGRSWLMKCPHCGLIKCRSIAHPALSVDVLSLSRLLPSAHYTTSSSSPNSNQLPTTFGEKCRLSLTFCPNCRTLQRGLCAIAHLLICFFLFYVFHQLCCSDVTYEL